MRVQLAQQAQEILGTNDLVMITEVAEPTFMKQRAIRVSIFTTPSSSAAACERSMTRPVMNGPRSLITTVTDLPF